MTDRLRADATLGDFAGWTLMADCACASKWLDVGRFLPRYAAEPVATIATRLRCRTCRQTPRALLLAEDPRWPGKASPGSNVIHPAFELPCRPK